MSEKLTAQERQYLLKLARDTIKNSLSKTPVTEIDEQALTPSLLEDGASFVTITLNGNLRGCIGSLEARQALAFDVREHAYQAAFEDYRFPPLTPLELPSTMIEISRLTTPVDLDYETPSALPLLLKPGVDGVILQDGFRRATFLPQVWQQLPKAEEFLSHLCAKMGAPADLWKRKTLQVKTYSVEEFHE